MRNWKTHPETFARSAFVLAGFLLYFAWGAVYLLRRITVALERIVEVLSQ